MFMKIPFCKLPLGTEISKIVSVNSITHWENDSLYIQDDNTFYKEYGRVFDCGIFNNLETGIVDPHGINYYPRSVTDIIIGRIEEDKPVEYEILLELLSKANKLNGFYILGI